MDAYERYFETLRERVIAQGAAMRRSAEQLLQVWRFAKAWGAPGGIMAALEQAHRDLAYELAGDEDAVRETDKLLAPGAPRSAAAAIAAAGEERVA